MRLPNFLFIGPDKAGSTWLQATLARHPQVFLPRAKDTYYFGAAYGRGIEWYAGHFAAAQRQHTVVGEICHDYLYEPQAPNRIQAVIPDAVLMVCLREPADRAFSAYLNLQRNGRDIGSFTNALTSVPELLDHSRYAKHLRNYLAVFPSSQLYVAWFDELSADPQLFLDKLTARLGLASQQLAEEDKQPARPAGQARFPLLARSAKRGALIARGLGMTDMIGRVKSSPRVQHALYKGFADRVPALTSAERRLVQEATAEDVLDLEALLAVPVRQRWGWPNES